ncbi:uncharacterized protein [Channa argus]|uniref:uncharacterized protein n=1 Tax=Channa argus TaxID=215402 RepID=UPI003522AA25
MKVLALFLLAVLGCSLIEGRLYTKCEVRGQLQQALNSLPPKSLPRGVTVDDLVAKIVCQAEESSGLNTSAVNQRGNMRPPRSPDASNTKPKPSQSTSPHSHTNQAQNHEEHSGHNHPPPHGQRAKRHLQSSHTPEATPPPSQTKPSASPRHPRASHVNHAASQSTPPASNSNQAENHEKHSSHDHPHPHGQRDKRHLESSHTPEATPPPSQPSQRPPQSNTPRVCTLFGIFQLSNHFACTDHVTPSANICGTDCSNFLDDNISEDIDCVMKIILSLRKTSTENNWENLVEMMQPMFAKKCIIAKASDYFAKC